MGSSALRRHVNGFASFFAFIIDWLPLGDVAIVVELAFVELTVFGL